MMVALPIQITLKQPLLIGQFGGGDENSASALSYIPGSVLRGVFIQRYIERHGDIDLASDANRLARQLFFSNSVHFLNSYPLTSRGQRMLPSPLSWRIEKEGDAGTSDFYDYALGDAGLVDPRGLNDDFWANPNPENPREVVLHTPARQIGMHNASEGRFRKDEENSTVFRYDALAPGQRFGGAILCDDASLLTEYIGPLLTPEDMYMGRSRSAGYGWVRVEAKREQSPWVEYMEGLQSGQRSEPENATLTLLSHTILRDPMTGGFTTDLTQAFPDLKPITSFVATDIIGGFNRKWGMPYPQMPVLCAGSVFVFDSAQKDVWRTLAAAGIGERRNEGFGRVAIDLNRQPALRPGRLGRPRQEQETISLTGQGRTLAAGMVERLYRSLLDRKLLALLNQQSMRIENSPENSQLSRLRLAARQAWQEEDPAVMREHLSDLAADAQRQYRTARINNQSFYEWLYSGWEEHRFWVDNFHIPIADLPRVGDVRAEATDALKVEYMARLVDGLCNKSVKEAQAAAVQAEATT